VSRYKTSQECLAQEGSSETNRPVNEYVGVIQMKRAKKSFVAFAILMILVGCQSRESATVPDELVGTWKTSAPKYVDRSFEIRKNVIVLGIGKGNTDAHPVLNLQEARDGEAIFYTISYMNYEGRPDRFSFYYDPARGGVIRFKNQQRIEWTRAER